MVKHILHFELTNYVCKKESRHTTVIIVSVQIGSPRPTRIGKIMEVFYDINTCGPFY